MWDEHGFVLGGKEGIYWETTKGKITNTKKARRRRMKKRGWGNPPLSKMQKKTKLRRNITYPCTPNVSRG